MTTMIPFCGGFGERVELCEGKELEKRSSVSLHWRNGTMLDDFVGSALSLCICMHWPRYMRDSLILPASARVEPAVFAARARSEPGNVSMMEERDTKKHTSQINNSQSTARPIRSGSTSQSLLDFNTKEAMTSAANSITAGTGNSSFSQTSFEYEKCFVKVFTDHLPQTCNNFAISTLLGTFVE